MSERIPLSLFIFMCWTLCAEIFFTNQSNFICISHIHKSELVSYGFNKVRHPVPLILNKSKDKLLTGER